MEKMSGDVVCVPTVLDGGSIDVLAAKQTDQLWPEIQSMCGDMLACGPFSTNLQP